MKLNYFHKYGDIEKFHSFFFKSKYSNFKEQKVILSLTLEKKMQNKKKDKNRELCSFYIIQ